MPNDVKTIALLLFLGSILFMFFPSNTFASFPLEIKNYPSIGIPSPTSSETPLPVYINYIYHLSLIIGVLGCIGVIIYGGFSYFFSAGMVTRTLEARKWIYAGLLGLFILLASWALLNTINPQFLIGPPSIEIPPPYSLSSSPSLVHTITYREIPLGQLIDKVISEAEKKDGSFQKMLDLIREVKAASKNLEEEVRELRDMLDNVKCQSDCATGIAGACAGTGKYGFLKTSDECSTLKANLLHIPPYCSSFCKSEGCSMLNDTFATSSIIEKENDIKKAIAALKDRQQSLVLAQASIISSYLSLRKAVQLMYTTAGILTYHGFMQTKEELEKERLTLIEAKSFEGWPSVTSVSRLGKLRTILSRTEALKNSLSPRFVRNVERRIKTSRDKVRNAENKANNFIAAIERATTTPESTPSGKATTTVLNQISKKLPAFFSTGKFIKETATDTCELILPIKDDANRDLGTNNPISQAAENAISDLNEIYASSTGILNNLESVSSSLSTWKKGDSDASTTINTVEPKLNAVKNVLGKIISKTESLLGGGKLISDPATFYYPLEEIEKREKTK
ncbi:hypothetical protein J7J81_01515 [bacterium]|nr:hypothetical protein [bacterium]